MAATKLDDHYNLASASVLLVCDCQFSMGILVQAMSGLGFLNLNQCKTAPVAKDLISGEAFDVIIVEASKRSTAGLELIKWLRTETPPPSCFAPVLITSAHTPQDAMAQAMDSGCDMIIKKPFTAGVLLDRIVWMGRPDRQFVFSDGYVGPERRTAQTDMLETNLQQQIADNFFG